MAKRWKNMSPDEKFRWNEEQRFRRRLIAQAEIENPHLTAAQVRAEVEALLPMKRGYE